MRRFQHGLTLFTFVVISIGAAVAWAGVKRAEVLRTVVKSTVVVYADLGDSIAQGSGTVLGRYGDYEFVVTCSHVIEGSTAIALHPTGHEDQLFDASVEVDSPDHDLALLVVKGLGLPVLPVARFAPELYDTVYALGAPQSQNGIASEGIITDVHYRIPELASISNAGGTFYRITNAYVASGISGGTATNTAGGFIGVPARGSSSTTQFGLLIPGSLVVADYGRYLGVTGAAGVRQ